MWAVSAQGDWLGRHHEGANQNMNSLELECGADRVEAEKRDGVGHDPVIDEAVAIKARRGPPPVFFFRGVIVQRVQLEFLQTQTHAGLIHQRATRIINACCYSLSQLGRKLNPVFLDFTRLDFPLYAI